MGATVQALEEERLGPRRPPYSDERNRRLAVQEGATALVCTLLPAVEPVTLVRARGRRLPPPQPGGAAATLNLFFCRDAPRAASGDVPTHTAPHVPTSFLHARETQGPELA